MARAACVLVAALALGGCQDPEARLALTGDIMLGRDVARACQYRGVSYPLAEVTSVLQSADLAYGNLECILTDSPLRFPRKNALIAGSEFAPALAQAGFDVLGLANNHAIDGGRLGLRRSMELLGEHGVAVVGAGVTPAAAEAGVVCTVAGLQVGFIAFSDFPYANFVKDASREAILILSEDALRHCIPPLRQRCEVLVVGFHWGKEGSHLVSDRERALAHLAVDLGATIIVGSHSHVQAPLERYGSALIAYGLGNLVFDDHSYGGNEGLILICRVGPEGVREYETISTLVQDCRAVLEKPLGIPEEALAP